jgi:hypothetical protein
MSNFDQVEEVLGFKPTQRPQTTSDVLAEAKHQILEERRLKAEEKAKGTMRNVIELCESAREAKKNFDKQMEKFNKELGPLLKSLKPVGEAPQNAGSDTQVPTT